MRYVIVGLINGEPCIFHDKLVEDVCSRFKVKRQKLQSHFTIKAPFETDNIAEIEEITEQFCSRTAMSHFRIDNYGHFSDKVVFMKIIPEEGMVSISKDYISWLKKIAWLEWKPKENGSIVFHCTVVSKLPKDKFQNIWEYVKDYSCSFSCAFDNITIMKWDIDRWIIHKSYNLK